MTREGLELYNALPEFVESVNAANEKLFDVLHLHLNKKDDLLKIGLRKMAAITNKSDKIHELAVNFRCDIDKLVEVLHKHSIPLPELSITTSDRLKKNKDDPVRAKPPPRLDVNDGTLHYLAERGIVDKGKILLAIPSMDVNKVDENGFTPLHYATFNRNQSFVTELLAHPNIDVNCADHFGNTPLIHAAMDGNESIVLELLVHPNIDVNRHNKKGVTAEFYAKKNGHTRVVKLLLDYVSFLWGVF